jgi:hypothetical protein
MQLWQIVAIGVSIVLIALASWYFYELNRARRLRERFGNEYDRRLTELGDRRSAETDLARSEERLRDLEVVSLSAPDRARFISEWRHCQSKFVDNPAEAVLDADNILTRVMQARGYRIHDRRDLVGDVCVAYPNLGLDYREASDIVVLQRKGYASTEALRKAFLNFRSVFDEMVENKDEFRRVG